jgi:hypothetical protein
MKGVAIGHSFKRELPKDDSGQVWFKLACGFRGEDFFKSLQTNDDAK